jgi:acetyl esterase/lipase
VNKEKNIVYNENTKMKLNVFSPSKMHGAADVIVFIHGGNWNSGNKSIYSFFGKGLAKKGIVAVIIDYRLYPSACNSEMALDVASALKWTKENIAEYGGDPERIFVAGHSVGGQLAALMAVNNHYFEQMNIDNPVKGCILIDAFGLDICTHLKRQDSFRRDLYMNVFGKSEDSWKSGSPYYYLAEQAPPFLMFLGEKTYPGIAMESFKFYMEQKKYQNDLQLIEVRNSKHVGMIFRFMNPRHEGYAEILRFIKNLPAENSRFEVNSSKAP